MSQGKNAPQGPGWILPVSLLRSPGMRLGALATAGLLALAPLWACGSGDATSTGSAQGGAGAGGAGGASGSATGGSATGGSATGGGTTGGGMAGGAATGGSATGGSGTGGTGASGGATSGGGGATSGGGGATGGSETGGMPVVSLGGTSGGCGAGCSEDGRAIVCASGALETCSETETCTVDPGTQLASCVDACDAAVRTKQSIGCEYYATMMDTIAREGCFAAFVANTWSAPAHLTVEYEGQELDVEAFTRIPSGAGPDLTYQPFDPEAGLAPGEVAILLLSGPTGTVQFPAVACPVATAIPTGVILSGTGIGHSFRVTSDVPVVAYQMNPYGGAGTTVTGASLLLPTSVWDGNYVMASAFGNTASSPSLNVIAREDATTVTIVPVVPVVGGGGIPASPANVPFDITLQRGEHAQISQADLTGSVLSADHPVGFMAGHQCMYIPDEVLACDHGEQMVPPVAALGSEYVGVMHRQRGTEPALWRLIGAVDGTALSWSSDVGGPATLELGEIAMFTTSEAFVVKSQDESHPFLLFAHMVGSNYDESIPPGTGDPDSVLGVPPQQFLTRYVFFADPTYPETNLVVVRSKLDGAFAEVTLDCRGELTDWTAVGEYEWTRVDLVTGNFESVAGCSTGRHVMESENPFGLWVWGWGSTQTEMQTSGVSYGYPGGMNVEPINPVVVPAIPRPD